MSWNKSEIVSICIEKCKSRIQDVQSAMDIAQDTILNDTKSSMGDKYETSREMAQQELNRLKVQLSQANSDLEKINALKLLPSKNIAVGSIVQTDQFDYFIAIPIGPLKIENKTIMVISKESPIAQLMIGKNVNDHISFNGKDLKINAIS